MDAPPLPPLPSPAASVASDRSARPMTPTTPVTPMTRRAALAPASSSAAAPFSNRSDLALDATSPLAASATLLREQQADRERLQVDNFNMKMRIAYLEERLLMFTQGHALDPDDLENEVLQLRMAVQEREQELQLRTTSILRATSAIAALQEQLAAAKEQAQRALSQGGGNEHMQELHAELLQTQDELQRTRLQMTELEMLLGQRQDELMAQHRELQQEREAKQDLERELDQHRVRQHSLELASTTGSAELQHLQATLQRREEELKAMMALVERLKQDTHAREAQQQTQRKQELAQMQAQVKSAQDTCDAYRAEIVRLTGNNEALELERDRFKVSLDALQQEKQQFQTEWERRCQDLDRVTAEADTLRREHGSARATTDQKSKELDEYKADRENMLETLRRVESEANDLRTACSERDVAAKLLERRCASAESEAQRLASQLDELTQRTQQSTTANDRLVALEQGKRAIEAQNRDLLQDLSRLQTQLETFESKCRGYEARIEQEASRAEEYRERCLACERELRGHAQRADLVERQLADASSSSVDERHRMQQQYADQLARVTQERHEFAQALDRARAQLQQMQQTQTNLESDKAELAQRIEVVEHAIRRVFGSALTAAQAEQPANASVYALLQDARSRLERHFESEAEAICQRWQAQAETMRVQLERLQTQVRVGHTRVEMLERSHAQGARTDVHALDRAWTTKYERVRRERDDMDATCRSLETALQQERAKHRHIETTLHETQQSLETLRRDRQDVLQALERDIHDLKESNRLLLNELQERRRAADHARKQAMRMVAENKDLLGAIEVLQRGISERDQQIEYYKNALRKLTQRGGTMADVKHKLLDQLEQTQFMVNETYKRWAHSELSLGRIAHGSGMQYGQELACIAQLDELLARVDTMTEQWREHGHQARELQRRYADAWRTAALSFGKRKDRPTWVDDVERKCSRLLTESARIAETMRETVTDMAAVLQNARTARKQRAKAIEHRRSQAADSFARDFDKRAACEDDGDVDVDDDGLGLGRDSDDLRLRLEHITTSKTGGKSLEMDGSRSSHLRKARSSASSRRTAPISTIYEHSLSSLGRIGEELKEIEQQIQTYPD